MEKNLIAVIGAGGKTTALEMLARESGAASVLLTTTTHIFPLGERCLADPTARELADVLLKPSILCAGSAAKEGKLGILPPEVLAAGIRAAGLTVYEADGAHYHPLKLHRPGEPVILPGTTQVLVVAGLSALGRPIGEAVHRYAREPEWAKNPAAPVGAAELVHCTLETADSAGVPYEQIRVLLNQADTLTDPAPAETAAELLRSYGLEVRIGSLLEKGEFLYPWVTGAGGP